MASDTKDRKAITLEEKHEELCAMIEKLTNTLTMIYDAYKRSTMTIKSASTAGDPIVNRFNDRPYKQRLALLQWTGSCLCHCFHRCCLLSINLQLRCDGNKSLYLVFVGVVFFSASWTAFTAVRTSS
jgi:hypothetical protein